MQKLTLPSQLWFLLGANKRYKVAHGGRSSAKSTSFCKALIARACKSTTRILCVREIQRSIKESVYQLLKDQINALSVVHEYEFTQSEIKNTRNGSTFIFYGVRTDPDKIKSLEGVDICYVEEANKISDESWEILIPTIRKEGSEIWIVFNGDSEDDPVYRRFILNQPPDCIVAKINYTDIPRSWLSPEIIAEAEYCKASDPEAYKRIWLGIPTGAGGRVVWTPFDKNVHVKEKTAADLIGATAFMAMDPHSKYFPYCLWVARRCVDNTGKVFEYHVFNEWPKYGMFNQWYHDLRGSKMFAEWGGIRDLAQQIFANDGEWLGLRVAARYIDTRYAKGAGGESWSTGTQGIVNEMAAVNCHFRMPAERLIDVQREVILDLMRYNRALPLSETNRPLFTVAPCCGNLILSLERHRTEEGSERESDKYKDASDALRICFAGMSTYHQEPPRRNTIPDIEVEYAYAGDGGWMT